MAHAPAMTGLRLTDTDGSQWNFNFLKQDDEGQGVRVQPVPWEAGMPARPWVRDLFPFDAGAARTKDRNPRGLSLQPQLPADTFSPDQIVPGPAVTDITLANATVNATKMIQATDNSGTAIFAICGRYLVRIASDYTIASTDLGSGNEATDITQINNELILSMGASDPIKRRTAGGTVSTSGDVYAHSIVIVRDRIWKVRNSTATVDNTLSYLVGLGATTAAALTTLSNWTTTNPAYLVGDNTYQCVMLYDNGGTIAGGRADGVYMPDPEYKFLNITPQIKRAPDSSGGTGLGCWSAFGYFFVPYHRGLLRLAPGFSEDVGPGTIYLPKQGLRVRNGMEWDRMMFVLCSDERNGDLYLFRMIPDKEGIADGEYIFQPVDYRAASTTHFGRALAMLTASTNPTLFYGGGSAATSAHYIKLGRGSGRDIDDANYAFTSSKCYVTTGLFTPVKEGSLQSTLVGSQVVVGTTSGATTPITVEYCTCATAMPGDQPGMTMMTEAGGSESAITKSGTNVVYAAPNSKNHNMNLRLCLDGTGTIAPAVLHWTAFGYQNPETADSISVVLDLRTGVSQIGDRSSAKASPSVALDKLTYWMGKGTVLSGRIEGYAESRAAAGKTSYFVIRDISAPQESVKPAAGGRKQSRYVVQLSLIRVAFDD